MEVVRLSGGEIDTSPAGASCKIYHSQYADVAHGGDHAKDWNREHSGSPKGWLAIHSDYVSMFGRWVTIGPKYNRNGSLNQQQCIVYGNRNPNCKAFNAYYEWFEDINPVEHCNMGVSRNANKKLRTRPASAQPIQTTVEPIKQTWDQLFEL